MNNLNHYFNQFQISRNQKDFVTESLKKHYSNGLSKYAQKISVYSTSDLNECKQIWEQFSPQQSLFDTWEFRTSFQEGYKHDYQFICLMQDSQIVAVLPLSFNTYQKEWQWFGSDWQEDGSFFALDPSYIPILLFLSPSPLKLTAITEQEKEKVRFVDFEKDESKFVKDITSMKSLDDFLATLHKKKRYNLKRDKRSVESFSPEITINNFTHYDEIARLTKKRYSSKNELADWEEEPEIINIFQKFTQKSGASYEARMLSLIINDDIYAVDLLCLCNDTYYAIKGGYDVENFPGIGNYMNLIEIEDAIKLGKKKLDFLQYNYGWKEHWFDEVPLYKYVHSY